MILIDHHCSEMIRSESVKFDTFFVGVFGVDGLLYKDLINVQTHFRLLSL